MDVQRNSRGRYEGFFSFNVLGVGVLVLKSFSRFTCAEFGKRAGTLTIAMTVRRASFLGGTFVELIVSVRAVGNADTLFTDESQSDTAFNSSPFISLSERDALILASLVFGLALEPVGIGNRVVISPQVSVIGRLS